MPHPRPLRPLISWCLCGLLFGGLVRVLAPELTLLRHPAGAPGSVDLFVSACAAALLACTGWLWIVVSAVVISDRRGTAARWLGAPGWLRRVVVVLCGISVVGLPTVAGAEPTPVVEPVAGQPPGAPDTPSLEGMTLPELPETPQQPRTPPRAESEPTPAPAPAPQPDAPNAGAPSPDAQPHRRAVPSGPRAHRDPTPPATAGPEARDAARDHRDSGSRVADARSGARVVVAPGDSLWSIARSRAAADATAAEIDRSWRRIWRANRDVIGADPDLIRPGQRIDVSKER